MVESAWCAVAVALAFVAGLGFGVVLGLTWRDEDEE
jgi:hypothetical protein